MSKHEISKNHIEKRETNEKKSLFEKKEGFSEKAKELLHTRIDKMKNRTNEKIKNLYKNSDKIIKGVEIATTITDIMSAYAASSNIDKVAIENSKNIDNVSSSIVSVQGKEIPSKKLFEKTLDKLDLSLSEKKFVNDNEREKNTTGISRLGNTIEKIGSEPGALIQHMAEARKIDPQKYEQLKLTTDERSKQYPDKNKKLQTIDPVLKRDKQKEL